MKERTMYTVWKFTHIPKTRHTLNLPKGARIIAVDQEVDMNVIVFWAEVNSDMPQEQRCFQSIWTGEKIPEHSTYLGTVRIDYLVYHLYEIDISTPAIHT